MFDLDIFRFDFHQHSFGGVGGGLIEGGEYIRRAKPLKILAENLLAGESFDPHVTQPGLWLEH